MRGVLGRVSELLRRSSETGRDVVEMIKAGPIVASLAATFSATLAAAASPYVFAVIAPSAPTKEGSGSLKNASGSDSKRNAEDKFVPRYDGLRFIETLVTAHR